MSQNKDTIKTKEIDGFRIITGFDQLPTDTAASLINSEAKIKDLPVFKELLVKSKEKEDHFRRSTQAKGMAKLALVGKADADKSEQTGLSKKLYQEYLKQDKEYKDRLGAAGVCNGELVEINLRLEPLAKEVRRSNLIYAEQSVVMDQEIVSELLSLFMAKSKNEQIAIETEEIRETIEEATEEKKAVIKISHNYTAHSVVPDFRGCQYSYKDSEGIWNEEPVIEKLGFTVKTVVHNDYEDQAIEKRDMTPEQNEEIRFQKLDEDEKLSEFTQKKIVLASHAAGMENELKFDGDLDFVSKAQAWYDSELLILKTLYGVE
jgi:hypothetical protein